MKLGDLKRYFRSIIVPITAIVLAMIIGAIILKLDGSSPIEAYTALFEGAFGNPKALGRTLEKATPLIFTGLAVAFAFKAGLFNIGAQGQLLNGAIVAAFIGFSLKGMPPIIHIPLALFGGALAGAFYAAIAGALKTYTGAHEVITTIMLNFVASNLTDYLSDGPWKDPTPTNIIARTPKVMDSAIIPKLSAYFPSLAEIPKDSPNLMKFAAFIPIGFFMSIIVAAIVWWILEKTTLGFEIKTVGQNPNAAKYAGMRVGFTAVLTMFLSGLLAGMGGAVETLGIVGRFEPGFNSSLGFDGITIALLGRTHPFGVIPAALLVGAMRAGASKMQFSAHVTAEIVDVVLALMLFFVAADSIVKWILRMRSSDDDAMTISSGWGQ